MAACQSNATGKTGYSISGHIKGLRSDSVYLYNTSTNQTESAPVKNENFIFKGKADYPEMYQVYFDADMTKWVDLFLENSEIVLEGKIDRLDSIAIRGSKSNLEYLAYRDQTKKLRKNFRSADSALTAAQDKLDYDTADSLQEIANLAAHHLLENVFDYASANPNSVIIPYIANVASMNAPDRELTDKIIALLSADARKNPHIPGMQKMFDDIERTSVGHGASDFTMTTSGEKKLTLSSLRGKVVLVDFWASWCEPCVKSFPELEEVYKKFGRDKFEIIGFSIDKDRTAWQNALKKYQLKWPQVVELNGPDGPTPKDYGIIFIPAAFLIDKQGKIAGINLHGKKLLSKIQELTN